MRPKTLSASAIECFECPACFRVSYIGDRLPDEGDKDAADLGTACHAVLETLVQNEFWNDWSGVGSIESVKKFYDTAYWSLFDSDRMYDDGWQMIQTWYHRSNADYWEGRTVLSVEQKVGFQLPTSIGPIRFNHIFDRLDRLENGDLEVVDYKTIRVPISADRVKKKVQCRIYAVGARIMHPDVKRVWVTLDQLRWEQYGVAFSRDECLAIWEELKQTAEKIIASDGTKEVIGPRCRYCPRAATCRALRMSKNTGGIMSLAPPQMVDALAEINNQMTGLEVLKEKVRDHLIEYMRSENVFDIEGGEYKLEATAGRKSRSIDPALAVEILGTDLLAKHGKINIGEIDKMVKKGEVTPEQAKKLEQAIRVGYGEPSVKLEKKDL